MNTTPTTAATSVSHPAPNPTLSTRWTLDPSHSAVGFSVRHLMITNVRGEFERFHGDVTYDPAHPEATRLSAAMEVGSINTREPKRDGDLKSPLFFDAEHHPEMTFVSKSARAVADGELEVKGDLTIKGISREVTLAVRDISAPQLDMRGLTRIGASAKTVIKRADFGMTWNKALETGGVVVGEQVTIVIEASLVRAT